MSRIIELCALEDHFSQTKRIVELIIKLVEKDELMQDEQEIAQELNTFFKNTASTLNINGNSFIINHNSHNIIDPILDRAIEMYNAIQTSTLVK